MVSSYSCRGRRRRGDGDCGAAYRLALSGTGRDDNLSSSLLILSQRQQRTSFIRFSDRHRFFLLLVSAALKVAGTICSRLSGGPVAPPPFLLREHAGGFFSSPQDSIVVITQHINRYRQSLLLYSPSALGLILKSKASGGSGDCFLLRWSGGLSALV